MTEKYSSVFMSNSELAMCELIWVSGWLQVENLGFSSVLIKAQNSESKDSAFE